jgi:hypothetical protein
LGIEIPGLWITGPQARKKRCPTTSTGAKELGTPKRKQTNKQQQRNNNNNNPISCRLPAGYLEGGSPQLPSSTPPPFIA